MRQDIPHIRLPVRPFIHQPPFPREYVSKFGVPVEFGEAWGESGGVGAAGKVGDEDPEGGCEEGFGTGCESE